MTGRYLTYEEAATAVRNGAPVEQLLGAGRSADGATIRWLEVYQDAAGRFVTRFVVSLDMGNEGASDIYAFPAEDAELPNGELHTFAFEADALRYAVESLGAAPERFVHRGKLQDEYADFRSRKS